MLLKCWIFLNSVAGTASPFSCTKESKNGLFQLMSYDFVGVNCKQYKERENCCICHSVALPQRTLCLFLPQETGCEQCTQLKLISIGLSLPWTKYIRLGTKPLGQMESNTGLLNRKTGRKSDKKISFDFFRPFLLYSSNKIVFKKVQVNYKQSNSPPPKKTIF